VAEKVFTGGPAKHFEVAGRNQLAVLLEHGLHTSSRVLDIGCGALRGGYWIMRVLDPGCYFGIEPNREMLQAGLDHLVEPDVLARAQPRFDYNDRFDFAVFGVKFDFYVARSIWTHSSKTQLEAMLDGFVATAAPEAMMLASILPVTEKRPDYKGGAWIGRSHESDDPGTVAHDWAWLETACRVRGLSIAETGPNVLNQVWVEVARSS